MHDKNFDEPTEYSFNMNITIDEDSRELIHLMTLSKNGATIDEMRAA